ncbi:hypothetical protein B0H66DRAFT_551800 [Apodospora peruviana]|uniref:Uncharacterized protein n=1 Tax=Apodospora peruviana TaxID=516989 RepID=A0AAE0MCM4_9PEZI|nr:hypothetical protein B0H66DRAFT_551800 [Apodospora peruviana]
MNAGKKKPRPGSKTAGRKRASMRRAFHVLVAVWLDCWVAASPAAKEVCPEAFVSMLAGLVLIVVGLTFKSALDHANSTTRCLTDRFLGALLQCPVAHALYGPAAVVTSHVRQMAANGIGDVVRAVRNDLVRPMLGHHLRSDMLDAVLDKMICAGGDVGGNSARHRTPEDVFGIEVVTSPALLRQPRLDDVLALSVDVDAAGCDAGRDSGDARRYRHGGERGCERGRGADEFALDALVLLHEGIAVHGLDLPFVGGGLELEEVVDAGLEVAPETHLVDWLSLEFGRDR